MEREQLITLVTQAQSGKTKAMEQLFDAFYNDVYYFALKTVKNESLACDITQETFVTVITHLGELQEPAAFVTWLRQIAYSQCTRYFRKRKDVLVDEDEEGGTIFDTLAEERTEFIPDATVDREDFRQTILDMLDELSEEQRSAVFLYYYDELSVKQIADIQGVSEGTVKSRLNYARKNIKVSVERYEKKNGVRLHSVGVLPLVVWALTQSRTFMTASQLEGVISGVAAITGTRLGAKGLLAKLLSLPVAVKATAGVTAVTLALGGTAVITERRTPEPISPTAVVQTTAHIPTTAYVPTTAPVVKLQTNLRGLSLELDKDFRLMTESENVKWLSNGVVDISMEYSTPFYVQPPTLQELMENNLAHCDPEQDRHETLRHKEVDCLVVEYGQGGMTVYAYYFWDDHAWTVYATGTSRELLLELVTGGDIRPEQIS